jgi:TrpR-related protein YerC/YecD
MSNILSEPKAKKLFKALLTLKTPEEVAAFCRDLMTESEIREFSSRLEVAEELAKGTSQRAVSAKTGVSIATVTRVNHWLKRGKDGYKTVLLRLSRKKSRS